jgi:hypothetical protein
MLLYTMGIVTVVATGWRFIELYSKCITGTTPYIKLMSRNSRVTKVCPNSQPLFRPKYENLLADKALWPLAFAVFLTEDWKRDRNGKILFWGHKHCFPPRYWQKRCSSSQFANFCSLDPDSTEPGLTSRSLPETLMLTQPPWEKLGFGPGRRPNGREPQLGIFLRWF